MRWFVVLSLAVGATAMGRAADEAPAPAAAASNGENSISAAKRDFDSIKAAREEALHPKSDLPRVTVPELQVGNPTPRNSSAERETENDLRKKAKSPNWLVDAMEKREKKSDPRNRGGKSGMPRDADLAEAWDAEKSAAKSDFTVPPEKRADASAEARERRETEPPPNPLAPFLAGWMTAQDYALLKPTTTTNAGGAAVVSIPGVNTTPANDSILAARTEVRTPFRGDSPSGISPSSAENPYLAALNEAAPALGALTVPGQPAATPNLPVAPPPPRYEPPPPPPTVKIPDFAKPANDERYFKPLKRF